MTENKTAKKEEPKVASIESVIGEASREYLCKWHRFHWEIEQAEMRGDF